MNNKAALKLEILELTSLPLEQLKKVKGGDDLIIILDTVDT